MQSRRLRSSEGMQKERLDQNQTQFDDDLRLRETGQDARIQSELVEDAIKKAEKLPIEKWENFEKENAGDFAIDDVWEDE